MIKQTTDCVGCADGCHNCGMNALYYAVFCDNCRQQIDGRVYEVNDKHICEDCLTDVIPYMYADDLLNS